jgi:phosphoglycerol transferase
MESMENTYTSYEKGGNQEQDLMPELYALAEENLNFSHRTGIGGQQVFCPTTLYTMGATVAQTGGVSLMTVMGMMKNRLSEYSDILPSLRRLEDILHDEGYHQLFIRGENTNFAGYNLYVGRYEDSTIYDYNSAKEEGVLPENYEFTWGMEDYILFPLIKEKMTVLAAEGAPFCTTIYTVDTHSYEGGNRCPLCDSSIQNDYAAAVRCSGRQVADFLDWLSEQPYYDDTVIILVGDHLADEISVGIRFEEDGYLRTTYNCFIHAQKTPENAKSRVFSAVDMFPTTLSAMGVTIDGDRLGLGTDLFSDQPTLCEMMGAEQFAEEIEKSSEFYNRTFW